MANSKIVFGGDVLMDLTADTVTKDKLLKGYTAHGADGEPITGECTFDSDTQDATATVAEILKDKTAYVRGTKLVGTMPNNGGVEGIIKTKDDVYIVPNGHHDGSGTVKLDENEKVKLVPNNIREGVTVLGVLGTMSGSEGIKSQTKEVTPTKEAQVILPDEGYNYLAQVTVSGIPYVVSDNAAGGQTVAIG